MFIKRKVQLRTRATRRHYGEAFILCLFLVVTYFSYMVVYNDGENILMTSCLETKLRRDAHISLKGIFPCQHTAAPKSILENISRFVGSVTVHFTTVLASFWVLLSFAMLCSHSAYPGPSSSSLLSSLSSLSSVF